MNKKKNKYRLLDIERGIELEGYYKNVKEAKKDFIKKYGKPTLLWIFYNYCKIKKKYLSNVICERF